MSHGSGPYGRDPFFSGQARNERGGRIRGQGMSSSSYYYQDSGEMHYPPPIQGMVGRHGGLNDGMRFDFDQYQPPPSSYQNFQHYEGRPDQGRFYRPPPRHDGDLLLLRRRFRGDYGPGIIQPLPPRGSGEVRGQPFYEGRRLNQSQVTQPPQPGWNPYEDGMMPSSFPPPPSSVAYSYHLPPPPDWIGKALFVASTMRSLLHVISLSFQFYLQHSNILTRVTRIMQMW